jgi:hypothetical protein
MGLDIRVSHDDLERVVRLALVPTMDAATSLATRDGRIPRVFRPDGDFRVDLVPLKTGVWSLNVRDDHGGDSYARVESPTIEGAIREVTRQIVGPIGGVR